MDTSAPEEGADHAAPSAGSTQANKNPKLVVAIMKACAAKAAVEERSRIESMKIKVKDAVHDIRAETLFKINAALGVALTEGIIDDDLVVFGHNLMDEVSEMISTKLEQLLENAFKASDSNTKLDNKENVETQIVPTQFTFWGPDGAYHDTPVPFQHQTATMGGSGQLFWITPEDNTPSEISEDEGSDNEHTEDEESEEEESSPL